MLRVGAVVDWPSPRRGGCWSLTSSRCQHHRSRGRGLQGVAGALLVRRGRCRSCLVSAHRFDGPPDHCCAKSAADHPETCRSDAQPLHSASVRRSECVAPVRSMGALAAYAMRWRGGVRQQSHPESAVQMNGPSSAWRRHAWRIFDATPCDTGRAARLLGNHEVPRNGRASRLSPRR